MPITASASRIAQDVMTVRENGSGLILRAQATGQSTQGETSAQGQSLPPGSERAEGAFGIFGMMISGLIILFAVVLLILRRRRS